MPTYTEAELPTFEEYAAAAWPSLYRRAYLLCGNHADAEDLAQASLIKIHASWTKVSRAESPHAYVRRILTNTFLSTKRHKGRRLELLAGDHAPEPTSPPVEGPEDRMALWPHVRDLPKRQRAVIVLRYYEQLSEAEIADALDCSRGNVKSTAHRALQNLRTALDGRDE
ncbi:SigE family RNA polymerase sigma factor [Nocardioides sp. HDW12B]|uniref:SigE family RNA polymerase sigma factor n=1 Tax=Nocardioides sp. HDW12B TaxID=2714939 RepID=UPI0014090C96|nr:SigE family RNA polymerase sigma factor [Nocardioides sp. HDW12B]QIK67175.1 SigE family RNA polymerase sigma factor [Nocardioides sp. HDW12B]